MTQSETAYDHYESYVDQLGQLRALNWLLYINIENGDDFSHYSSGIYGISEGLADKLETVCNHMHERMVTLEEIGDELISDGKPKTWLTKEEIKQAGKGFPKAVPYHEFFNLDKATGEPLPEKEPTPKHIEVREQLIAASYKQGHSIGDIAQAVNLKKQHIEKVLLGLAVKGELPNRDEGQPLTVNQ